jgi:hypothetical protein
MLVSYSSLWVLGALMPGIFRRLGFTARGGTALWGLTDLARVSAFVVLALGVGWHGRRTGLLRTMVLLPTGFVLMLFAPNLPLVLLGELLFGWGAGECYYAALYYAMVVENASVQAGGGHESLIGLGFALGPAAGLVGVALAPLTGDQTTGVLLAVGGLMLACSAQSLRALARAGRRHESP